MYEFSRQNIPFNCSSNSQPTNRPRFKRETKEVLHASRDLIATVTTPPSYMPGQNNMGAVVGDRVPSLRGYRVDSLSAENRAIYDAKFTANIDPYTVSANFFLSIDG